MQAFQGAKLNIKQAAHDFTHRQMARSQRSQASMGYVEYKFISPPKHAYKRGDVMSDHESVESLAGKFVAQYASGATRVYRVFKSCDEFLQHLEAAKPAYRKYHEVIFDRAQKIKFDIDAKAAQLDCVALEPNIAARTQAAAKWFECVDDQTDEQSGDDSDASDDYQSSDEQESEQDSAEESDGDATDDDADAQIDHKRARNAFRAIVGALIDSINDCFLQYYDVELDDSAIVVCESIDEDPRPDKYSVHIIIDRYYVEDSEQASEFTRRVLNTLPHCVTQFVDIGVNKSLQHFRVPLCSKDDQRVKHIHTAHTPINALISDVRGCSALPRLANVTAIKKRIAAGSQSYTDHPEDTQRVLALCREAGLLEHFAFRQCVRGLYTFDRLQASYCEFCQRTHDADNTLLILAREAGGTISVYKQCRKYNAAAKSERSVKLGEFTSAGPPSSALMPSSSSSSSGTADTTPESWSERLMRQCLPKRTEDIYPTSTLFDALPPECKVVYDEPTLRDFQLSPTLVIHAAMKMGKTKKLQKYLAEHFTDGLRRNVIRFVSFRQTFSGNIKERFHDFTLYSDVKGPLRHARLIIQVESLHRLQLREEPPDLLILDECESIFEQFQSGLGRAESMSFQKFKYLMRNSKHVICMDANISDRTFRVIEKMRPGPMLYHHNTHQNCTADSYYFTADKLKWYGALYHTIEAGSKLAIPMSSFAEASILHKNLRVRFPELNIGLYSRETSQEVRKQHFGDVDKWWSQYDVLIYTPTVSAGVSFEARHFDRIFGYFISESCSVETCTQMIGRIRDVVSREFYLCVESRPNALPCEIEEIKSLALSARSNLYVSYDAMGLQVEYEANGQPAISVVNSDMFTIWLENERMRNLSRNSFLKRFIWSVKLTGAITLELSDEVYEQLTDESPRCEDGDVSAALSQIAEEHKEAKNEIRSGEIASIANAEDITRETAVEIATAREMQLDITEEQKWNYERYKLRSWYHYTGEIDERFVAKYCEARTKTIYRNLCHLGPGDVVAARNRIQTLERDIHEFAMTMDEVYQDNDVRRKYTFEMHRWALLLLRLCGWEGPNDEKYICIETMRENVEPHIEMLLDRFGELCYRTGMTAPHSSVINSARADPEKALDLIITYTKKISSAVYGCKIHRDRDDPDLYELRACKLFTNSAERSVQQCKPYLVYDQ
jgi:hypothetical protein